MSKKTRTTNEEKQALFVEKRKELIREAEALKSDYGLEAAIILHEAGDKNNDSFLWPSREKCDEIVKRFVECPEVDKGENTILHEEFLKQRIKEKKEELKQLQYLKDQAESSLIFQDLVQGKISVDNLSLEQAYAMNAFLGEALRRIEKVESNKNNKM